MLLRDPATGEWEVGIRAKAIGTLESLLFAKYQMFRSVYWHHGVRAATGFYKRIVEVALAAGLLSAIGTDRPHRRATAPRAGPEGGRPQRQRWRKGWRTAGSPRCRNRRLPKSGGRDSGVAAGRRVIAGVGRWRDRREKRRWEDALAAELDLEPGEVILDFPVKRAMFQLDVLVDRPGRPVRRLGRKAIPGLIDLPKLAEELYRTARVLRLFTFERRPLDPSGC